MTVAEPNPLSVGAPILWIYTSAGPSLGFGHLRRSLVVANALRDCCIPVFILAPNDSWSKEHLENGRYDSFSGGIETAWELLPKPAAILIDTRNSGESSKLNPAARDRGIPIISIHDLGLNMLPSDVLIDGSIAPGEGSSANVNAIRYSGADYMILDRIYRDLHLQKKTIRKTIQSIFINLGGGNSSKYYLKVLEGLRLWGREVEVIGVPGFTFWGQEKFMQKKLSPLQFRWENRHVEQHLFRSDLAITAGGIAAYEALCAGTPLLALAYDPLQQITVRKLNELEACIDLGLGDEVSPVKLAGMLFRIAADVDKRRLLSDRGRQIVDGQGCERVTGIIRQLIFQSRQQAARRV